MCLFELMVFSGYMPSSGIAGSYGNSIFSFLRNLHTVFHSGCTNLHSHQQCTRVPFSPCPRQHLLFVLFDDSHSDRCEVISIVVLICISLMVNDVEHLFHVPIGHLHVLFGKMSILFRKMSVHFLLGLFVGFGGFFLMLSYMSDLYVLDINPLSVVSFANIFSHSVGCLFVLSMVSFALQKLLSLIRSHLFIFAFISFALGDRSKEILLLI